MKYKIFPPHAIHEIGQRKNQEDTIFPAKGTATTANRLFMVCDGMGGHEHGEVASGILCKAVSDFFAEDTNRFVSDVDVKDALDKAYEQLDLYDDGAARKMGTTFTFVALHSGGVTIAHIGDSRIYHIRPSEHVILYKSRDHSLVYDLYQAGEISFDEMSTSPQKNVITRAMMPGEDNRTRPDIVHSTNIKPGDYFYLCSDGMLEQISDQEILDILCARGSDEDKCRKLIENSRNNKDNHSAYLIHIEDVEVEPNDSTQPNNEATAKCNAVNIDPKPSDYMDERDSGISVVNVVENNPSDIVLTPVPVQTSRINRQAIIPQLKSNKVLLFIIAALAVILILPIWYLLGGKSGEKENPIIDDSMKTTINHAIEGATEEQTPIIQRGFNEDEVSSLDNIDAIQRKNEGVTEETSKYTIVKDLEKAQSKLKAAKEDEEKAKKDKEDLKKSLRDANSANRDQLEHEMKKVQESLNNAVNKRIQAEKRVKELERLLNNSD